MSVKTLDIESSEIFGNVPEAPVQTSLFDQPTAEKPVETVKQPINFTPSVKTYSNEAPSSVISEDELEALANQTPVETVETPVVETPAETPANTEDNVFSIYDIADQYGIDTDAIETPEQYLEQLEQKIAEKVTSEIFATPGIARLNELAKQGEDIRDIFAAITKEHDEILALSNEDLVRAFVASEHNLNADKLDNYIKGLKDSGKLDTEAELLRAKVQTVRDKDIESFNKELDDRKLRAQQEQMKAQAEAYEGVFNSIREELTKSEKIFGIDFSKPERDEVLRMFVPDKKTGESLFEKALDDPKSLMIMATAVRYANKLQTITHEKFEAGKKVAIQKLAIEPASTGFSGSYNTGQNLPIDSKTKSKTDVIADAFAQPESLPSKKIVKI